MRAAWCAMGRTGPIIRPARSMSNAPPPIAIITDHRRRTIGTGRRAPVIITIDLDATAGASDVSFYRTQGNIMTRVMIVFAALALLAGCAPLGQGGYYSGYSRSSSYSEPYRPFDSRRYEPSHRHTRRPSSPPPAVTPRPVVTPPPSVPRPAVTPPPPQNGQARHAPGWKDEFKPN